MVISRTRFAYLGFGRGRDFPVWHHNHGGTAVT
jgi:hypothetical protein